MTGIAALSKQSKKWTYLLYFVMLLWLLWRAPYGFCFNDEPFCVTLAQRLWLGDGLIVDEWHGVQNFGPVLLPFYALFRLFSGSNEGVLLAFRYVYCFLWWGVCVFAAERLSRRFPGAWIAFLYMVLFSPLDYMNLSYTSVGLMAAILLCVFLYELPQDAIWSSCKGIGIFAALWVVFTLCVPAMAAAYVLVLIGAPICAALEKRFCSTVYFRNLASISLKSVIPVGITAAVYLFVFLLSRHPLSQILESIPYLLADPEHSSISFYESFYAANRGIIDQTTYFFAICVAVFFAGFLDPKKVWRFPAFFVCAAGFVYYQMQYLQTDMMSFLNGQMLNIVVLGAAAFALLKKRPYKLFLIFYGGSYLYTILNNYLTNTGMLAVSMTLSIAGMSAVIFIVMLLGEFLESAREKPKACKVLITALVCIPLLVQISSEAMVRGRRTYWDNPLPELTYTIPSGPAKGLKTEIYRAAEYERHCENLTALLGQTDTSGKSFLSCTSAPYIYLHANLDYATFSAWSFGYGEDLNARILDYQKVNPDKVPDLVYCASEEDILPFLQEGYDKLEHNESFLFVKR